jgi:hypothetical protein
MSSNLDWTVVGVSGTSGSGLASCSFLRSAGSLKEPLDFSAVASSALRSAEILVAAECAVEGRPVREASEPLLEAALSLRYLPSISMIPSRVR